MSSSIIFKHDCAPGDWVVLSGLFRDIHACYPGRYEIYVDTAYAEMFAYSPWVKTSSRGVVGARHYIADYGAGINSSNQIRRHFMWAYHEHFNKTFNLNVHLTELKPSMHLIQAEMATSLVKQPYWLMLAGGKSDFSCKIWDPASFQKVVDMTKGQISWVQAGRMKPEGRRLHTHPTITGVHDMRGRTSLRDLMRLIYHADGVLCPITASMHLSAAFNKPCVVLAGGREPWWWEAYTQENRLLNMQRSDKGWKPPAGDDYVAHRFLETMGQLECCHSHGCWKSKIEQDMSNHCTTPHRQNGTLIPRCLAMLSPEMVVEAIMSYQASAPWVPLRPVSIPVPEFSPQFELVKAMEPKIASPGTALVACIGPSEDIRQATPQDVIWKSQDAATARHVALNAMLAGAGTDIVVLFADGAYPRSPDWLDEVKRTLSNGADVLARIHKTDRKELYPDPSFLAMKGAVAEKIDWLQADSPVALGRQIQRAGFKLKPIRSDIYVPSAL